MVQTDKEGRLVWASITLLMCAYNQHSEICIDPSEFNFYVNKATNKFLKVNEYQGAYEIIHILSIEPLILMFAANQSTVTLTFDNLQIIGE